MSDLKQQALEIAIPLIARFEGCRLHAYKDAVGVPTIGYGSTRGVKMGDVWTQEKADERLREEVSEFMDRVMRETVAIELNPHELAALTSFAYNLGIGAFHKSTLRRKLLKGDKRGAADEFHRWNHAGGRVLAGLTRRREDEREVFLA